MDNFPLTFYTLINTHKKRVALFDWFKDVKFDNISSRNAFYLKK